MFLRNIPFSPPDMSEAEAKMATEAILSGWITTGPKTKEFERKIACRCHTEKAACLNSATAAMELALRMIGVGSDDEVIIPAYTYTATASVTQHVGCKLVMIDSQADSVEMDYDKLAEAINVHTKVVIPVDLGGVVADYDKLFSIVKSKKHLFKPSNEIQKAFGRVIILSDGAHAFGASRNGKMCGEIADFTAFSFHAVKNITTAEGGALTWNLPFGKDEAAYDKNSCIPRVANETWNEYLYRLCQMYSLHGQNKDAFLKTKLGSWEYDIVGPWYKCNMTDIMAGIGISQLERYDKLLSRRKAIVKKYCEGLAGLPVQVVSQTNNVYTSPETVAIQLADGSGGTNHHIFMVRLLGKDCESRNQVIDEMSRHGIATNVHFKPLPMMTAYKALGFNINDYPNAYNLFQNEITLPLHTKLSDDDVEYVIYNFIEAIQVPFA